MPPKQKSEALQDSEEAGKQFEAELITILSTPLNPENIDSYADITLGKLIDLMARVTASFTPNGYQVLSPKGREDLALDHFGLNDVGEILDTVSLTSIKLNHIDDLIGSTEKLDTVILPTEEVPPEKLAALAIMSKGSGGSEKGPNILRLKTALFILGNEFNVDIDNEEECDFKPGILLDSMMRKESFYRVYLPKLGRTILVCDERGNMTFVFNDAEATEAGIDREVLVASSKDKNKQLLQENPALGGLLRYGPQWASRFIDQVRDPHYRPTEPKTKREYTPFQEPVEDASPHDLTIVPLAKKLGVGATRITAAKEALEAEGRPPIGTKKRFGSNRVLGFSPSEQSEIETHLREKGFFEAIPEGHLTATEFADALDISKTTVYNAIRALEALNKRTYGKEYFSGKNFERYLSLEEQAEITNYLRERGVVDAEIMPETHMTIPEFLEQQETTRVLFDRALERLNLALKDFNRFRYKKVTNIIGLSPEERKIIATTIQTIESETPLEADDSVTTLEGIRREVGANPLTIKEALKAAQTKPGFGKAETRLVAKAPRNTYTMTQKQLILDELDKKEKAPPADPSDASASMLGDKWKRSSRDVDKAIKAAQRKGDFGEVRRRTFRYFITDAYDQRQQQLIYDELA